MGNDLKIGDEVYILEPRKVKKGKIKLIKRHKGTIIKYGGQIGLGDETSVWFIDIGKSRTVEISEDFLVKATD